MVDGYLYRLDFAKGVEEGEESLLGDAFWEIADVDRALEVLLLHLLYKL